jgi:molybdate transport system substrate-binding protein
MWWLWFGCGAPGGTPAAPPLRLLAASSLVEVAPALGEAFHQAGGPEVVVTTGASPRLVNQLEAGAPADVLWVADGPSLDAATPWVNAVSRTVLATNTLVLVVPASQARPLALDAVPSLGRLALADVAVPAGRYARAALAPVWAATEPHVVTAESARATLAWVALGEADGGVVYATDARAEPRVSVALAFPTDPPIVYPAAVTLASAQPEPAAAFLSFCASADGQAILARFGFGAAPR